MMVIQFRRLGHFNRKLVTSAGLLCTCHAAHADNICDQLIASGKDGIYYAFNNHIQKLHPGVNANAYYPDGAIYAVMRKSNDGYERVDHLKIVYLAQDPKQNAPLSRITLQRNRSDTVCHNNSSTFPIEFLWPRSVPIKEYDRFRNPHWRGHSPDLESWHFQWNASSSKSCLETANEVPPINNDLTETNSNLFGSYAAASGTPGSASAGEADTKPSPHDLRGAYATVVFIHQKTDQAACSAIAPPTGASSIQLKETVVQSLKLGGKKRFAWFGKMRLVKQN